MHPKAESSAQDAEGRGGQKSSVCADESKASEHQGQVEHEISGPEVLEYGFLDCAAEKAEIKLTLTKLLKFTYPLTG